MYFKTTKQIIEDSFKNQEFNQKEQYPTITKVFDTLEWAEENNTVWVRIDDVIDQLSFITHSIHHNSFDLCHDCSCELEEDNCVGVEDVTSIIDNFVKILLLESKVKKNG